MKLKKNYLIIVAVLLVAFVIVYFVVPGIITGMFVKTNEIKVIGETDGFSVTDQQVCTENGKVVVYFFGHSGCSHCQWEHPILSSVIEKFSDYVSFHDNMDSNSDSSVYSKYSEVNQGYVPFLVIGCKYVRVGSGEVAGEQSETETLTNLICSLTEGIPLDVCSA